MMVRTQISLTEEQHTAVVELARRTDSSMSAVIRDAVDHLVALANRSVYDAMRDFAGSFSDPDGHATDHDAMLEEILAERYVRRRGDDVV